MILLLWPHTLIMHGAVTILGVRVIAHLAQKLKSVRAKKEILFEAVFLSNFVFIYEFIFIFRILFIL